MTSTKELTYDLAVIGAGSAGLTAALHAAELGAKTVLIEKDKIGGYDLWSGSVPSKVLIKSAKVYDTIKRAEEFGVHVEQTRLIWGAVKMRVADVRDDIKKVQREALRSAGIEVVVGTASFVDANTLRVTTTNGEQLVRANKFIIATGASPRIPEIDGLASSGYILPHHLYNLPTMPRTLTILGGGPAACEFAHAFGRFGSKVTVLHTGDALLPGADAEVSAMCRRLLEQEGVKVHLQATPNRVHVDEDDMRHIELVDEDGNAQSVQGAQLLIAGDEEPNFANLGLEAIGVRTGTSSIIIDNKCRTSAEHIWACGSVVGTNIEHAQYVAKNALTLAQTCVDYREEPWAVFTDPEIAWFGATESEATAKNGNIRVFRRRFDKLDRAIIEGETQGFIKVIANENKRLLGVHIVGPGAAELIHQWAPAIRVGALMVYATSIAKVQTTISASSHGPAHWTN